MKSNVIGKFVLATAICIVGAAACWANQGSPFDLTPPSPTPPQPSQPSMPANPSAPSATPCTRPKSESSGQAPASAGCPPYHMVEQTCYVPVLVHEKRKVQCIEYSTEQRQQAITLMRTVPEKQTIKQQYVVLVPETRTRTENYTVCKPVQSSDCGGGCGCGGCCTKYVQETHQRQVQYTVCVPQTKDREVEITVCKYVPEQRNITVSVCVPHTVEREVDVCAYRLTTKKVMVPVLDCCPAPSCCGYGWGCGWGCGWGGGCW